MERTDPTYKLRLLASLSTGDEWTPWTYLTDKDSSAFPDALHEELFQHLDKMEEEDRLAVQFKVMYLTDRQVMDDYQ